MTPQPPPPRTIPNPIGRATYAYPSTGGILYKFLTEAELTYLSLSPTDPIPSSQDPSTEDAFALRLLSLGARWWHTRQFRERWGYETIPLGLHYPPDLHIGYPASGGVVVLKLHAGTSTRLEGVDLPARPMDWGRLEFAETMEKRCFVLRRFGAETFGGLEECGVAVTLERAKKEGKRYEVLLGKWEGPKYLDGWFDSMGW